MIRYGFNIRTRTGQRVDNIHIVAGSMGDAERRLRQMYLLCEIIDRREQAVQSRNEAGRIVAPPVPAFASRRRRSRPARIRACRQHLRNAAPRAQRR